VSGQTVYLGLGSNVGSRERLVFAAVRLLDASGLAVTACSSLYETDPAEGAGGGRFINAVVEVRSLLCPADLLNRLKTIEKSMGRTGGHNRPREIDIDILSVGDAVMETVELTIPHPRYSGRPFVLLPLREIAPGFRCPLTGRGIDELIEALGPDLDITRVSGRRIIAATSL
jgi:2-amino-4-hydroxy-6-hydroxymethyldihydropteridine diphosphokinase